MEAGAAGGEKSLVDGRESLVISQEPGVPSRKLGVDSREQRGPVFMCGWLCGSGELTLYRKENSRWVKIESYCNWIR